MLLPVLMTSSTSDARRLVFPGKQQVIIESFDPGWPVGNGKLSRVVIDCPFLFFMRRTAMVAFVMTWLIITCSRLLREKSFLRKRHTHLDV
jgi:hypothetical protein